MTSPSDHAVVASSDLRQTIAGILYALGLARDDAEISAELLVDADLAGVDSHGSHLLAMYVRRIRAGEIQSAAKVKVIRDEGPCVWLDAGLGMGQPAGMAAVRVATERAATHGSAVVSVREATHLGALGGYTRRLAEAGLVGMCFQNGPTVVPPFGGVTPMLSTNPLSYAVPTAEEPIIVFDIATTAVAGNKLLLAKKRGDESIPVGWANDEFGQPTTDTEAASVWNLQWFGGHKGFGLAMLIELLAGVMAGSSFGRTEHTASPIGGRDRVAKGFVFIAIDPERFVGSDEFRRRADELVRDIRSSARASGVDRIFVPGEIEHIRRQERLLRGIPLASAIVEELNAFATEFGAPGLRPV